MVSATGQKKKLLITDCGETVRAIDMDDDLGSPLHHLLSKPKVGSNTGSPTLSKESTNALTSSLVQSNVGDTGGRSSNRRHNMFRGCCAANDEDDGSGRGRPRRKRCVKCVKSNLLTILTMSSVLVGVGLSIILRSRTEKWTPREIMYITFPGDLFLRMLKCLILPLIVSSMVAALGGLDLRLSGRIGIRAVVYYMATTFSAVVLGIILVSAIHPGRGNPDEIVKAGTGRNVTTVDTLMDLIRNLFPPNIVESCISHYRTILIYEEPKFMNDSSGNFTLNLNDTEENATSSAPDLYSWKIKSEVGEGTNILGLVCFSIVLGIAIGYMQEKGRPLQLFFHAMGEAMMLLTSWVIWLSPLGIMFLVCGKMLEMETFSVIIGQLGMYFLTVMIGLFIHGFLVIPLIYAVVTRTMPFTFVVNLFEALITAFGTASSSATLPVTLRCLEDKNGVDKRVARFVIPIGATINMDGTALYEAVAALFIAQVRQVPMDVGKIIAVSITATAASIGAAGIPQAGLITMVMVLNAVGLPAEDVTLIIVVDWLLDRFRTLINVLGDSVGAGIVNHLSKAELERCPETVRDDIQLDEVNGDKHVNGNHKLDAEITKTTSQQSTMI